MRIMEIRRTVGIVMAGLLFCIAAGVLPAWAGSSPEGGTNLLKMYKYNFAPNSADRTPELNIVYYPDVLTSSSAVTGTTFACSHGFPWESDTKIPLILFGKGIRHQAVLKNKASLEDIAPTLAHLLDVKAPSTSNGRVLYEALSPSSKSKKKPRLALVFTLDQCRADYFTDPKINDALSFARKELMGNGAYYGKARLSYAGSRTAVSHTVIGTGATPGIHGIVGNEIKVGNDFPLAFDDLAGNPMDASNLRVPTLADVMDLELKNEPKIIAVSAYGRAALGMGGHGASFSKKSDKDTIVELLRDTGLPYTNDENYKLPEALRHSSGNRVRVNEWLKDYYGIDVESDKWTEKTVVVDNGPYAVPGANVIAGPQGKFADGSTFTFEHAIKTAGKTAMTDDCLYQLYKEVPVGTCSASNSYFTDTMKTPFYTLWAVDMLLRTIEAEGAGLDRIPDLVYFNFKSLDTVGHAYGVNSPEVYTYLYYTDYLLKKITYWLDEHIGRDNYTMVVTADHGAHNAYGNRNLYRMDLFNEIENNFGTNVILNDPNDGDPFDDMIYLDNDILANGGYTPEDVAAHVEKAFPDHIYRVITKGDIFSAGMRHGN